MIPRLSGAGFNVLAGSAPESREGKREHKQTSKRSATPAHFTYIPCAYSLAHIYFTQAGHRLEETVIERGLKKEKKDNSECLKIINKIKTQRKILPILFEKRVKFGGAV